MPGAWVYGVVINLMGSVCINGGTNLMKHGHNLRQKLIEEKSASVRDEEKNPLDDEPDPFAPAESPVKERSVSGKESEGRSGSGADVETPINGNTSSESSEGGDNRDSDGLLVEASIPKPFVWYVGTVAFVTGSILNFVSFSFAAQSLLSALGSTQFISNVFFGKVVLGEDVTLKTIIATLTIIAGNAMVVYFSSHSSRIFTAQDLLDFYDTDFNFYLFMCLGLVAICRGIYQSIDNKVSAGLQVKNSNLWLPLLYAITSAVLGTQSVVQAKCLSILLRATLDGDNQLTNWFTYFVLFYWLGATSFWLTRMNKALSMFDGLFIIPVLQVFWTFFAIVSGGIYFEEFKSFTWPQMIGFIFGVSIVFLGVYMLSPKNPQELGQSVGDDPSDTELRQMHKSSGDVRGYSWDRNDPKQRMVSVWATSNDGLIAKVIDADPLSKIEKDVSMAVGRKVTMGGQAVRKFSRELIEYGGGSSHQL
jgi:hypothetical protein